MEEMVRNLLGMYIAFFRQTSSNTGKAVWLIPLEGFILINSLDVLLSIVIHAVFIYIRPRIGMFIPV
jgi:hypothetical protein